MTRNQTSLQVSEELDPLWQSGKYTRDEVYGKLSFLLDKPFHAADIRSEAEGWKILEIAKCIAKNGLGITAGGAVT